MDENTSIIDKKSKRKLKLKNRITEIDFLRGLAVILMIFDHTVYDLWALLPNLFTGYPYRYQWSINLYTLANEYWDWNVREAVRHGVVFVFMALTGVSCSFSKSNFKRGIKLLIIALLLSLGTFIGSKITGDRDLTVIFGILHCIATTLLIVSLIEKLTKNIKDDKWVFLAVSLAFLIPGFIFDVHKRVLYGSEPTVILLLKGMVGLVRVGSDCYSLLLYGGQILLGVFLGKLIYRERKSVLKIEEYKNNLITFFGRNSLIVYFAHQVLVPVFIGIIFLFCGFTLSF